MRLAEGCEDWQQQEADLLAGATYAGHQQLLPKIAGLVHVRVPRLHAALLRHMSSCAFN